MKGLFITLEGGDGSGKSTIARMLKEHYSNYEIIHTREPGGSVIAEKIRALILDPDNKALDPKCEALLYAASRRQHIVDTIIPALRKGAIIICERFLDSSLAYQGFGRELGFEEILNINLFAIENIMPDITIYLDVDSKLGLERIENRLNKDRLDLETSDFHKRTQEGYKFINEYFKNRIHIIDANKNINEVFNDIKAIVDNFLKRK